MKLEIYNGPDELATAAADLITATAIDAITQRGVFNIALSGGSTPLACYRKLAAPPFREQLDWSKTHIFWSDERCVPPTHIDSNYAAAKTALLDAVPLSPGNIHRMPGELEPEAAAEKYSNELTSHFRSRGFPIFDLILLGLGEDGHTASLFPRSQALVRGEVPIAENYVAHLESWRLTFTLPLINAARNVVFLVAGAGKASVVREVVEGGKKQYPAKAVNPQFGELTWLLDKAAASKLSR